MTEPSPAWAGVLPDEDYQHSFGLKAGSAEKFFAPTERHAELLTQRRHWLRTDPAHCASLLPGAEPLLEETIALARQWNSLSIESELGRARLSQRATEESDPSGGALGTDAPHLALGEAWEPDYVLLKQDAADGRFHLLGGCVCFPSSWRFEEKVGKPLEVIHTPVPHLNEQLASPIHNFLSRIKPGAAWCRANWGLSRSPELNQHPAHGLPKLRPPLREDEVWLRVEDQALIALPESRGVLFGIRMTVIPLAEVKRHPAAARGLSRALRTMPDEMLDYKSLMAAKEELLGLLEVAI
ncbi:MAG: heme-dependent oxidative N-demethylase subunit alpha family protein [Limisphaerales bacterium]